MSFRLVLATDADLPFVMMTERLEGYDQVVGRWDENRHRSTLGEKSHAYFIGIDDLKPVGFAILRGWASAERVTLLKRIAVVAQGQGHGQKLLAAVIDRVFQDTDAHRLWLSVFPENHRARRAYEAVGFVAEGIARGSAFFGGTHRDELVMSILRPEWTAIRAV